MTDTNACKGDGPTPYNDAAHQRQTARDGAANAMIEQVMKEYFQVGGIKSATTCNGEAATARRQTLEMTPLQHPADTGNNLHRQYRMQEKDGVRTWVQVDEPKAERGKQPAEIQHKKDSARPQESTIGLPARDNTFQAPKADTVEPRGKHTRIEESGGVQRLVPNEHSTWHLQLQGKVDFSQKRDVFDVDLYSTTAADIAKVKANGGYAIAYMNAGAWQPNKPDSNQYPDSVIGKTPMKGWPEERWLDIRQIEKLRPIIAEKMKLAKDKGFDAVDPDNMDGYTHKEKYFNFNDQDQIRFNKMVAEEAHKAGLAVFLKNADALVPHLAKHFDGSVVEEAFEQKEAVNYQPMRDLHKPVFSVEYKDLSDKDLAEARARGFNVIRGRRALKGGTTVEN
jgi:hypothetical protein